MGKAPEPRRILLADMSAGGHHVHYLQQTLGSHAGEEVHILAPRQLVERVRGEFTWHPLPEGRCSRIGFAMAVRRVRRRIRPDMTVLLYADYSQFALWVGGGLGGPGQTVAALHSPGVFFSPGGSLRRRIRLGLDRWAMACGNNGLCWRVHTRSAQAQLTGRVGAAGISMQPYPHQQVAIDRVEGQGYRQHMGIPERARLLLCFGGTRHEKGADLAASALSSLPSDCHLLIAGAKQDFGAEDLRTCAGAAVERLHLDLRRIPDEELPRVFGAADVVLLPYRRAQCESGPLGTAILAGIPVVAAKASGWDPAVINQQGVWPFVLGDTQDMVRAIRQTRE